MDIILQGKQISKAYAEGGVEVPVLEEVNLEIQAGESLSITGPSGAGKSTLLHVLGTIDTPNSGQVFYQGQDLFGLPEEELAAFRNKKLGFVFQFHHLLPEFNALENVMMPLILRGEIAIQRQEKATRALESVGLESKASSLPGELSGGEQQRVAVARAVVTEPELLLADEPTGNLDRHTGDQLMDLLFRLNKERGLTLVYVTHNETLAERAGRTLHLEDGKVR